MSKDGPVWGEDPHQSLAIARGRGDIELEREAEERAIALYLRMLRSTIENVKEIAEILINAENPEDAVKGLISAVEDSEDPEIFRDAKILDKSIRILVQEYELQKKDPGLYIVDESTGRSIIKAGADNILDLPAFKDEFGRMIKPNPILHPKWSSALGMLKHERGKQTKLKIEAMDKVEEDSTKAPIYAHILDPNSITHHAKEELTKVGIDVIRIVDGEEKEFQVGKEHIETDYQSMSIRFHRAQMFGKILAKKIEAEIGLSKICSIGRVEEKKNSKHRWYSIMVRFKETKALQASTN